MVCGAAPPVVSGCVDPLTTDIALASLDTFEIAMFPCSNRLSCTSTPLPHLSGPIQPEVRFIAKQNSLMKIGNHGNLVFGPFDESTPCMMIVLMNCQTKLRINDLTAVKSVAILERMVCGAAPPVVSGCVDPLTTDIALASLDTFEIAMFPCSNRLSCTSTPLPHLSGR
ncbi:hypothetical protein TNCV_2565051 [Trichonephila clavipes]|uniref:Uncharacterized protein n=1 Tax=Trichonephila clavipes TaxID=2585209 RepID=A0A8X6V9Y4_TRICX|nr:hypothetical protein TNCV_2565051 [Trichonephila clavipes]